MTLVYLATGWLLGIILAAHFQPSLSLLAALALLPFVALVLRRHDPRHRLIAGAVLCALLGAARYTVAVPEFDTNHISTYAGTRDVVLEGVVATEPDVRDRHTNLRVATRRLHVNGTWRTVDGLVLVQLPRYPARRYGDVLHLAGGLETPPEFEDFDYRAYLARQGVHVQMRWPKVDTIGAGEGRPWLHAIYALKQRAHGVINAVFPEPEASLLSGILLGIERGIPADVWQAFVDTNTAHIVVISGFNIAILAGVLLHAFGNLIGRRRATWLAIGGIAAYTVLVGADAAVVRAAFMGSLYVLAIRFGRQSDALTSLAFAAVAMTLLTPFALWDVGFQLSFAATLGLIAIAPPLREALARGLARITETERAKRIVAFLNEALIITVAAQIATTPILVYHFHRLSVVGLLSNLAVIPAQPAVMLSGGATTLLGLVALPLARAVAWLVLPFALYTIRIAEWMARLPHASVDVGHIGLGWVWAYFALLATVILAAHTDADRRRDWWQAATAGLPTKAVLSGMSLVAVVAWLAAFSTPDGRLHVVFLDVGQGDATFVETPGGAQAVIDGGPSPSAMADAVGRRMPFWDRTIELLIMTHADDDHITGLIPLLERYTVTHAAEPGVPHTSTAYRQLVGLLDDRHIPVHLARAGMRIHLGDGVWLEVLHPAATLIRGSDSDTNNNSIVVRLEYGNMAFLLPADVEAGVEARLRADPRLRAQVLKLAHHGSGTSSTPAFLAAVQPWVAAISVGADNRYGLPDAAVLDRVDELGIRLYRTDQHGDIEFVTDGERLWVRTER